MKKMLGFLTLFAVVALMVQLPLGAATAAVGGDYVDMKREAFQKEVNGKMVDLYTLTNKNGMVAKITTYGGKLLQLLVPDKNGKLGDVVLGYETLQQTIEGQGSLGATVGRYANRIG